MKRKILAVFAFLMGMIFLFWGITTHAEIVMAVMAAIVVTVIVVALVAISCVIWEFA